MRPSAVLGRLRLLGQNLGLLQTRCVHCLTPFTPGDGSAAGPAGMQAPLCPACAPLFAPFRGSRCRRCALPLRGSADETLCGECLRDPPPWDGLAAYALYQDALRNAILRLKFGGEFSLAPLLGACLAAVTATLPLPDAVAAIPQHPRHLRRRGFNQAHELAKALHRLTGVPLRPELLRRTAPHTPQTGLPAAERRRNVRQSFEAAPQIRGLRLWLVDDVMTTGVTLRAAAQALRAGGAREITALVVARTAL